MKGLTTQWLDSIEEFYALAKEWDELLLDSTCDSIFMTWEWLYTWWENMGGPRKLAILTIRQDRRLLAIAPMAVRPPQYRRMIPFRVLELLGTDSVGSDYLSIIIRRGLERQILPTVNDALEARGFVIEMSNTDRDSSLMQSAAICMGDNGHRPTRRTQTFSPYSDLSKHSWQSFMAQPGKPSLTRFNKKLKRLRRDYNVIFEPTVTEDSRQEDLSALINLHLKRWDTRGGSNALHMDALFDFHDNFSRIALQKGWLRLFIMRLNNKPAAAVYGLCYNNTFYYYQAGFDPAFSQYGLGYLGIGLTIQHALAEGAMEYDFLHGDEEYKYVWADDERELVQLRLYPPGIKGFLCGRLMDWRQGIKRFAIIRSAMPQHAPLVQDKTGIKETSQLARS